MKSIMSLRNMTNDLHLPLNISFDLFDAYVSSILNYCAEIWGFSTADILERLHRKFLKRMLNVKMSTNNLALYGETGRFPLFVNRKVKVIKYWFKIMNCCNTNYILYTVYSVLLLKCNQGKRNWISNVRDMLQLTGLGDVWTFRDSVINVPFFIEQIRLRLKDLYIAQWREGVQASSALALFYALKTNFEMSSYLTSIDNIKHRHEISKLRLSS